MDSHENDKEKSASDQLDQEIRKYGRYEWIAGLILIPDLLITTLFIVGANIDNYLKLVACIILFTLVAIVVGLNVYKRYLIERRTIREENNGKKKI